MLDNESGSTHPSAVQLVLALEHVSLYTKRQRCDGNTKPRELLKRAVSLAFIHFVVFKKMEL